MVVSVTKDNKAYWVLMDCEKEKPYYFNSESAAKNFAERKNMKDFIIGAEGKN